MVASSTQAGGSPGRGGRGTLWRRLGWTVLLTFLLVELGMRLAKGELLSYTSPDDRERYRTLDPVVGYVPRDGLTIRPRKGNFRISTGEHGTRSNGPAPAAERPLTLVVGDSFAFGDDVDDHESWPAVLQRLAGRRVVNAAVPGFGLDQAVLRAIQLVPAYRPEVVVVSFIPHDVLRCEMSRWSGNPKPHFELEGGALRYVPADVPVESAPWRVAKRVLSASVTIDSLFLRGLHGVGPDIVAHHQGAEVACALMDRLATLGRESGARVVVLAQPQRPLSTPDERALKDRVLACAARSGLLQLDVFPAVDAVPEDARHRLFKGHMTAEGNRLVAAEVHAFVSRPPDP